MENLKYMTDYHSLFDADAFLDTFWNANWEEDQSEIPFLLKEHHKFWSSKRSGLKVLEFGGGPALANLISAAKVAKSITFADYTKSNRDAVNAWMKGEPQAHDWSSMISYVVHKLENETAKDAVALRSLEMREKIKPVIPCDITEYPIVKGAPYDVVSTSFCVEECSLGVTEYQANIAKLCELLSSGGYLHMAGNFNESFYVVGNHKFYVLPLEEEIVLEAIRLAEMTVTSFEVKEMKGYDASNRKAVFSISARKN